MCHIGIDASQNDRKSKGFAFKTPGAALTMQKSAAVAEFAAVDEFAAVAEIVAAAGDFVKL